MGFQLDYENERIESINIRNTDKIGKQFAENYAHFDWRLTDKFHVSGTDSIYCFVFGRRKDDARHEDWCALENKFQALHTDIHFKDGKGVIGDGNWVNPDYLDYRSDKPFVEEYKLTKGKIIFNTLACFCLIGFLLWADSLLALNKNKNVRKIAQAKAECKAIMDEADAL